MGATLTQLSNMEAAPRVCVNMSAPFDKSDTFVSFRENTEVDPGSNNSDLMVS